MTILSNHPPSLRTKTAALLEIAGATLNRRPGLLATLLLLLYIPSVARLSQSKALWHDELFTYYIAQAPSLSVMWAEAKTLDLNPPLVYLFTRWSFRLFGVNTLAARLPEVLFFLLTILVISRWVWRRNGVMFAGFTATLLLLGKNFDLAIEARPYALLLGFWALALLGWQQASDGEGRFRPLGILLLGASAIAMLFSHLFAAPMLLVLLAGECWRTWKNGTIDRPVALALMLPLFVIPTYGPMLRNHAHAIFPIPFQPTGSTIFEFYIGAVERELTALLLTALAVFIALGPAHLRVHHPEGHYKWSFPQHEWVVIVGLLMLPLLFIAYFMVTHGAFFPRYGMPVGLGVPLLATALLVRWTAHHGQPDPAVALLGLLVALLVSRLPLVALGAIFTSGASHSFATLEPRLPPCQACRMTAFSRPNERPLPLVDASGLTFLEMNNHESAQTTERLYYLTDSAASTNIAHANIFERMSDLVPAFHLGGHVMKYADFVVQNSHFYVFGRYDYPEDWVLPKLVADGASVRIVGRTSDAYRDTELYEVNISPERLR